MSSSRGRLVDSGELGPVTRAEPTPTADADPGRRRTRRLIRGIATTVLSRGIGALVPLGLIPVTLSHLGPDLYGLWMAAAALTGMAAFADLGLGHGLMTRLATCHANGDLTQARRCISSAYLALILAASAMYGLVWSFAGAVPWPQLFNVTDPAMYGQARTITLICLTAFILNIPLSLVVRVQYAYQQVAQSNLWQACGVVASLPLAVAAVRADSPPAVLVAVIVFTPLLGNLMNSIWLYTRQMPHLAPAARYVDRSTARSLMRLSGLFLALTVAISVAANADALVVAHVLGLQAATSFAVPARFFAQLGALVALVNTPFWPANGEALARGQLGWIRRLTRRMTLLSLATALLPGAVLVLAGGRLLHLMLDGALVSDRWLLGGMATWWIVMATLSPRFMVQNAAGLVRPQLWGWSLYLVLSIPGKWVAARYGGVAAVPWAGVAAALLTLVPAALFGYRTVMTRTWSPVSRLPEAAQVSVMVARDQQ